MLLVIRRAAIEQNETKDLEETLLSRKVTVAKSRKMSQHEEKEKNKMSGNLLKKTIMTKRKVAPLSALRSPLSASFDKFARLKCRSNSSTFSTFNKFCGFN